jgi:flavin-dependent dehydrogenase
MKVIIIGASTSGLFAAHLLSKEGVDVEVYERENALGWPPRTLIVTDKIKDILGFSPKEAVVNRVKYLELFSGSRSAKLRLDSPDLVVERRKLLQILAHLAEKSGAKIILQHRFEGFAQVGRKIAVKLKGPETREERYESTDILIGADGPFSAVSRAASRDGHLMTALLQARVPFPENGKEDTSQVWFDPHHTKYFYWLIPESGGVASVGLIADHSREAETCLKRFLQERNLEPLEFQAAMVPIHRYRDDGHILSPGRNVFIMGDAAAQVKVTTVGGIVTGLCGARALANAILNKANYREEWQGLKHELDLHLLVRSVLNRFQEKDYDDLIALLDGSLKDVLEKWTRDDLRKSFFKLFLTEPRLIMLGGKAFLRSMLSGPH